MSRTLKAGAVLAMVVAATIILNQEPPPAERRVLVCSDSLPLPADTVLYPAGSCRWVISDTLAGALVAGGQ